LLPDGRLWISGGDGLTQNSSYVMDKEGNFEPFFTLPGGRIDHCVVIVDERTAIIATGYDPEHIYK